MNLNRKWALGCVLALATATGIAAVGCGDDSTATPAKDAGKTDSGNPINTVDGSMDTPDGSFDNPDTGAPTTLYERLGKRDGIAKAVKETVEGANGEASDVQILSYFAIRTGGVSTISTVGGDPNLAVVEDCFTQFVAKAAGGPEVYPYTSTAAGSNGFVCRDMATAHAGLFITSAAFQKFVSIAAAKLGALGVSQADLQTLGGALLGTATDIVSQSRTQEQLEAGGFDAATAATNYAARCSDISDGGLDGGPAAKACITY